MWPEATIDLLATWGGAVLLLYSFAGFAVYITLGLLAFVEARRQRRRSRLADRLSLFEGDLAPSISILVPAFNEEPTIVESVRSLMQLQYPSYEIVVVNDGSSDRTMDRLVEAFDLRPSRRTLRARVPRERVRGVYSSPDYPFLIVLDVVRGGKARALNIALAFSRYTLFLTVDADSILERETLVQLALPFYEDASVVVVGGVVRPANGCVVERGQVVAAGLPKSHLAGFQCVEYLRGMLAGRLGWNLLDCLYIVSGALGLFSREAVLAAGGYRESTLGEDMDLVMRLQRWAHRNRRPAAVRFVGSAIAWTEVPEDTRGLARQRARWHQGLAESLWSNRELLLNTRFAFHHGLAFLFQLFVELLGPVIELAGIVMLVGLAYLGRLDLFLVVIYLAIFMVGGTVASLLALALERVVCPRYRRMRDLEGLALYALLENLGYRQLTSLWRVLGLWNALRRRRQWGGMARRGHAAAPGAAEERRAA